jgi:hypothetical protein
MFSVVHAGYVAEIERLIMLMEYFAAEKIVMPPAGMHKWSPSKRNLWLELDVRDMKVDAVR